MSLLTVPYVSVAEFKAFPTYLDLDVLRIGDPTAADQDAELTNELLKASQWAVDRCDQPLHAHTVTEQRRIRPDRYGRIKVTPAHGPVRQVTAAGYGYSKTALSMLTDLTGVWIDGIAEDPQNAVVVPLAGPQVGPWSGSLQFGGPVPGGELYVTWTAIAGYPNTLLAATAAQAATALSLADTTGIQVGDVLRINEPGKEEAVTVASTWVPATGAGVVPLVAGLLNTHTFAAATPINVSMLPHTAKQAVVNYACALLLRPDVAAEDPFPDAPVQPTTRATDSRKDGSGLVAEAVRLLRRHGRVPR